jgi:phenylacetate-CoA ligase
MHAFWKGEAETATPDALARDHLSQLRSYATLVYESSPFYRKRFDDAGVDPDGLDSFDALSAFPVVTKQQIIEDQESAPPYGTMLGVDPNEIIRQYIGPGPQTTYFTREDLDAVIDDGAWCMYTNGFRSHDVVDVTIMYHWVIAGTLMDDSYRSIGCAVIPGGIGMSQQHLDTWRRNAVTGLFAFPTFLDELAQYVESVGIDPREDLKLRVCTVTGEQRSADAKTRMEAFWGGMKVREIYGGSEVPFVAAEADEGDGMYLNPDLIVEVVNPDTLQPVTRGDPGVLVLTDTRRRAYPMLRYFTGDITEGLTYEPGKSGRTMPRMGRILGRAGDIARVKGLFVVPTQVAEALATVGDFDTFQLIIDRPGTQDTLLVRIEDSGPAEARPVLAGHLIQKLKDHIRLTCDVELVDLGVLGPEAPVVVDQRAL